MMRVMIMVICFLVGPVRHGGGPPAPRDGHETQELTKRVAALEKALAAEERKSDARDKLLAGWFDEYHPRGGDSRYHRNQVQWKTR